MSATTEAATRIVLEFCEEESIEPDVRQRCLDALAREDYSGLSNYDLFVVYDALGCEERDDPLDKLYLHMRELYAAGVGR